MNKSLASIMLGGVLAPQKKGEIVFLLGPPCGGKGVAAAHLTWFQYQLYSSSQCLRDFAETLPRKDAVNILSAMDRGDLVDVDYLTQLTYQNVLHFQRTDGNRAVFDGYWRTRKEVEITWSVLLDSIFDVKVLILDASDECVLVRAKERERYDDFQIAHRLKIFREHFPQVQSLVQELLPPEMIHYLDTTEIDTDHVSDWAKSVTVGV